MQKFIKSHKLVIIFSFILAIIPFLWLKPGEMDLGGDASRLYFYDPLNYLKNFSLYSIVPYGIGEVRPDFYNLPLFLIFVFIKSIVQSSTFLISMVNSIKFVVGFAAVYAIVKELTLGYKESAGKNLFLEGVAILAGLFYVLSPGMATNLHRALLSHNQIFINPLMFYLILRFLLTLNMRYIFGVLLISFVFSHNFSYAAAPPFFSFYPLSILFLTIYIVIIKRRSLPWKKVVIGIILFFGIHAFHFIPELLNTLDPQSHANLRIFNKGDIVSQVDHFFGAVSIPNIKVSLAILAQAPFYEFGWISIVMPLIVSFGFLLNKKKESVFILTGLFFLITLFLVTAKVTYTGVEFYSKLFYAPGFSMFRNFWVQWAFVYSFFYSLLFGQALFLIFSSLSKKRSAILFGFLVAVIVINGWRIISGQIINQNLFETKNVKTAIVMDSKYEESLAHIRSLPNDSKILTLPFSDCCYQVVHGTNNGAYVGMSTIAYLAGKKDFSGHGFSVPYSEAFFVLAKEKDYTAFKKMLGLLNIQYVFHNSDPKIYDTTFPGYPYSPDYSRKYFPSDQGGYKEFVKNLTSDKIFEKGTYKLYSVKEYFLPHFYIPKQIVVYGENPLYYKNGIYGKALSFLPDKNKSDVRSIYLERTLCVHKRIKELCHQYSLQKNMPNLIFQKINPTKYKVWVSNATTPYILVFSESFNKNWKVYVPNKRFENIEAMQTYFDGEIKEGSHKNIFFDSKTLETINMKSILDDSHFAVNAYANAWYIQPSDIRGKKDYELIIEMVGQRRFYFGLTVSFVTFILCIFWRIRKIF